MSAATSWVAHCVRERTNNTRPHSAFSGRMWSSSSDAAATWARRRRRSVAGTSSGADARVTSVQRIIFSAPAKNLYHSLNFRFSANEGVNQSFSRLFVQIRSVGLKGSLLILSIFSPFRHLITLRKRLVVTLGYSVRHVIHYIYTVNVLLL